MTSKSKIVAVILAYYSERFRNVQEIIADLRAGSVVPDKIMVLNNSGNKHTGEYPEFPGADLVVHAWNTATRGKYFAALMEPANYYLLLDDDISVRVDTLKCLMNHARPGIVIAGEGRNLLWIDGSYSYSHGESIWPNKITLRTRVDTIVGQLQFLDANCIAAMISMEPSVRFRDMEFPTEGEDILVGLANMTFVVPMNPITEAPRYLDERGVCLPNTLNKSGINYGEMRDRFTRKCLTVLRHAFFPLSLNDAPWRKTRNEQ